MGKLLELNQYLIREKFWKIFGNKFRVMDAKGELYGFCEQKRFRIKDELNLNSSKISKINNTSNYEIKKNER